MFDFDLSDELREWVRSSKDKALVERVKKKIGEIVSRDEETIDGYKNLRKPLEEFKRVHIGNFVLTFRVYKEKRFVFFHSLRHHDEAYRL
ncbi:Uncharacterised protein [Candidatus Norongarragalina meridionalis]|nr:Uncharacterised protein [Candidatus Norongarragalina meridionalis]